MAKQIRLETRQQLNIYMSPVRQELMRLLRLAEEPMTPKALADRLGVSPSSVQHHSGVAHLSPEEREELLRLIRAFLLEHDAPAPGRTERWEYVLMAHRVGVRE